MLIVMFGESRSGLDGPEIVMLLRSFSPVLPVRYDSLFL
jgi:hypothetical protein